MIKFYLFSGLICFISMLAIQFVFASTLKHFIMPKPKYSRFRRFINSILICLIPVVRWIVFVLVTLLAIVSTNEEMVEKMNEKIKK